MTENTKTTRWIAGELERVLLQLRGKASVAPTWTWDEIETELQAVCATPHQRDMYPQLLAELRSQSPFLPPAATLRMLFGVVSYLAEPNLDERLTREEASIS